MCRVLSGNRAWWGARIVAGGLVAVALLLLYVQTGLINARIHNFESDPVEHAAAVANGSYTYAADLSCAAGADGVCGNFTVFASGALASAGNPPVLPFGCRFHGKMGDWSLFGIIVILASILLPMALSVLQCCHRPVTRQYVYASVAILPALLVVVVAACSLLLSTAVPLRRSSEFDLCWPDTGGYDILGQPVVGSPLNARNGWAQGLVPDAATFYWLRDTVRPLAPQLELDAGFPQNFSVPYQANPELAARITNHRSSIQAELSNTAVVMAYLVGVAIAIAVLSDMSCDAPYFPQPDAPPAPPPPPATAADGEKGAPDLDTQAPPGGDAAPASPAHGARNRPPPSP